MSYGTSDAEDASLLRSQKLATAQQRSSASAKSFQAKVTTCLEPANIWRLIKHYAHPKNSAILLLTLGVILIGTTNRVFFKKMLNHMENYPYFLSQLTTVIYLPIFWPIVWAFFLFVPSRIPKEARAFPMWKWIVMGVMDAFAGVLMTIGGVGVSGPMQQLLIQSVIPLTMLMSYMCSVNIPRLPWLKLLDARYKWGHYAGAFVIIVGIGAALANKLVNTNGAQNSPIDIVIFFGAIIPTAASGVFKEIAFKGEADLDVYYVNAWVSTWQLVVGLLLAPITAIPGFGGVEFTQIPESLWDGAKCLVGINSLPTDNCHGAWIMVLCYIVANIFYNVVLLMMLKYGSAALLYVASAAILPLANIAFTFRFIMGSQATSLDAGDISGLILILLGLLCYRSMRDDAPPAAAGDGEDGEADAKQRFVPVVVLSGMSTGLTANVGVRRVPKAQQPKSVQDSRALYYARIGLRGAPPRGRAGINAPIDEEA